MIRRESGGGTLGLGNILIHTVIFVVVSAFHLGSFALSFAQSRVEWPNFGSGLFFPIYCLMSEIDLTLSPLK